MSPGVARIGERRSRRAQRLEPSAQDRPDRRTTPPGGRSRSTARRWFWTWPCPRLLALAAVDCAASRRLDPAQPSDV